jgi:flagellar biogenesis protein FliO
MHMKRFVFRRSEPTARISSARKLLQVATAATVLPCVALAQSAPAASEPAVSGGGNSLGWFGGELLLLALIAACAWTALYVWKRKRQLASGGGDERVQVLGVTSLGVRERMVVVRVRERTLLVGVTAAQITLLADLDVPAASRSPAPQGDAPRS